MRVSSCSARAAARDARRTGIRDEDIERLRPLGHEHITLTGRYRIALPDPLRERAVYRPLKAPPPDAAAA
jgi:hypothetical protein